jgi:putative tryptophan/tyrosine transport system substrate-binding protein
MPRIECDHAMSHSELHGALRRRDLWAALLWCITTPLGAAQPRTKPPAVAYLGSGTSNATAPSVEAFRNALAALGWVEGRTITIEYHFAEGRFERLPGLAAEIVGKPVDLIVTLPTPATVAAARATTTIPIVGVSVADPVGLGLAKSLARPGGNVTGLSFSFSFDVWAKQLQILKDTAPRAKRIAVLINPLNPGHPPGTTHVKAAAQTLGLSVRFLEAGSPEAIDAAFAALAQEPPDALIVLADSMFSSYASRIGLLSMRQRLPTMHGTRLNLEADGLILFAPNLVAQAAQAAAYVDKILKGAKPGELPFEQPNRFELVVNLRTARALGLAVPQSVLLRADQLIE